jgi:ubiquinone/menaquinone biosynthesis C-methylase UbiE
LDYERLYNFRFRNVDQDGRMAVWKEVAPHVHSIMGKPEKLLDPAAGRGEFLGAVPAGETWAVDAVSYEQAVHKVDTNVIVSPIMDAVLPDDYFDGIYVSNFLEHLYDQEAIHQFLLKMIGHLQHGGRIAIMGPNYRYCASEYWDYADHFVPQYLPYSFTGNLPTAPWLVGLYLKMPLAWRVLGKQFLVIGRRP